MKPLTREQELRQFRKLDVCHICNGKFNRKNRRVMDHDHLTGNYRGPAHYDCNLNVQVPHFMDIFFHNLSGYDLHIFVKELFKRENTRVKCIPKSIENYLSFSIIYTFKIPNEKKIYEFEIRFLDSFKFQASSLAALSDMLKQKPILKSFFPIEEQFNIVNTKGIYPYNWFDSFNKLQETKLPSIKDFYNELCLEHCKPDNYKRACDVWKIFNMKEFREYHDLYMKTDVLI